MDLGTLVTSLPQTQGTSYANRQETKIMGTATEHDSNLSGSPGSLESKVSGPADLMVPT